MPKIVSLVNLILITLMVSSSFASVDPTHSVHEVWNHHIDAWVSRDLDRIVEDYTDDSTMIVNGEIFVGKKEIRQVFQNLFVIFDQGSNKIDPVVTKDRLVYITWQFQPEGDEEYCGTDTFIIEDGKIAIQTIASPLYKRYPLTLDSEHHATGPEALFSKNKATSDKP